MKISVDENVEPYHYWCGCGKIVYPLGNTIWDYLVKLDVGILHKAAVPQLAIPHRRHVYPVFTAAIFVTAKMEIIQILEITLVVRRMNKIICSYDRPATIAATLM